MQRKLVVQPRAWRRYIFTCSHSLAYIILKRSVSSFPITRKGITTFFFCFLIALSYFADK